MRRLQLPPQTVEEIVALCCASIQDKDISQRLSATSVDLAGQESDYIAKGQSADLFSIATKDTIGAMSIAEMRKIYKNTFVKSRRTRGIYDWIKSQPRNGFCPTCGCRPVFSLDHYLAQSHHAALTIVPANLVPACLECNKLKESFQPVDNDSQMLHPYFDDADDALWLKASVIEGAVASMEFSVLKPPTWSESKFNRVVNHFNKFELNSLFVSYAGEQMIALGFGLQIAAQSGGVPAVRLLLNQQLQSWSEVYPNTWQRAMFEALSQSDWYCGGGFVPAAMAA